MCLSLCELVSDLFHFFVARTSVLETLLLFVLQTLQLLRPFLLFLMLGQEIIPLLLNVLQIFLPLFLLFLLERRIRVCELVNLQLISILFLGGKRLSTS